MRAYLNKQLSTIMIKDFNLCLFISFCILAFYHRLAENATIEDTNGWFNYVIIPAFNGFLTAFIMLMLNLHFKKKSFTAAYYTEDKFKLMLVAFLAGYAGYYLTFSHIATYAITLLVISLFVAEVKSFFNKLSNLLTPDKLATPEDISYFINFFINLIITFTVIYLAINTIHSNLGLERAFNFQVGIPGIIDALYFSIITMTTVGYGDIIPHNPIARILVSLECITCYLMLGIMIGIVTRGISFKNKP